MEQTGLGSWTPKQTNTADAQESGAVWGIARDRKSSCGCGMGSPGLHSVGAEP